MKYTKIMFLVSLYILIMVSAAAAEEGIFIAGTELRIGMSRGYTLQQLEGKYKLTQSDKDNWLIFSKDGPPYKLIGSVAFKNNQVSWIGKDWGSFHEDAAVQFAKELYSVLNKMKDRSQGLVKVKAEVVVAEPGLRVNEISFVSGNRKIAILVTEGQEDMGGKQVSIQESLSR
jgi:hypothetical protein